MGLFGRMSKRRDPIIKEAVRAHGSIASLSEAMGLTYQAIWKWRRIPAERVREVESLTGISRKRLRPDLYGDDPPDSEAVRHREMAAA